MDERYWTNVSVDWENFEGGGDKWKFRNLTFRNLASFIEDGHTATLNTLYFYIFFQKLHVLNFFNMLHTLHFFLFKMPFIS
jgi:hypothetical protein